MRKVFFVGLCLLASACGASATTRTATPITESSAEAREAEPSPEELELYALQEEACSQPGAGNGPVVLEGVSFYCFAD
jgi:hypothetical protein